MEFWKWMAALAAVSVIGGCASAPDRAAPAEAPRMEKDARPDGAPSKLNVKDPFDDEGGEEDAAKDDKKELEGGEKSPDLRAVPADAPSSGGGVADPRATVDALSAELEQQVGSYREDFGVESGADDYGRDSALTCDDICDVKSAICTSSSKICTIAQAHPGDDHIQGRCTWATTECGKAEDACTKCR